MATKALISAGVVTLALFGCTTMQPTGVAPNCTDRVCLAKVTVVDCNISVVPDTLPIARDNARIEIHWDIDQPSADAGFTFTGNDGIVINDSPPQFSEPKLLTPTKFKWKDENTDRVKYKYTVNVKKGSMTCPLKDPFIQNGS